MEEAKRRRTSLEDGASDGSDEDQKPVQVSEQ